MPTLRQKRAFKSVVNGSTIKSAMVKAGYSPKTAHRTNKLTRTRGWEALMKEHLPDSLLAKRHRELLNKREIHRSEEGEKVSDQPETQAVSKALDMAYKLKKRYELEPSGVGQQINIFVSELILKKNEPTSPTHVSPEPNSGGLTSL